MLGKVIHDMEACCPTRKRLHRIDTARGNFVSLLHGRGFFSSLFQFFPGRQNNSLVRNPFLHARVGERSEVGVAGVAGPGDEREFLGWPRGMKDDLRHARFQFLQQRQQSLGLLLFFVTGKAGEQVIQHRQAGVPDFLCPGPQKIWNAGLPVLDDLFTGFTSYKKEEKTERLLALLQELKPGVTEIIFHASRPTEEFPLVTGSSDARHADLRALTDPRVKKRIADQGIILTTWKELKERRKEAAPME